MPDDLVMVAGGGWELFRRKGVGQDHRTRHTWHNDVTLYYRARDTVWQSSDFAPNSVAKLASEP